MNKDAMRIAVAEILGWRISKCTCGQPKGENPNGRSGHLPNYPEDLNACAEMERTLSESQRCHYNAKLFLVATGRPLSMAVREPEFIWQAITASPAQRNEAFLRTHNKWPVMERGEE